MDDEGDTVWRDWIAFNRRRADEERAKAEKARSEHDRACRLILADIFEARAAAPGPVPAPAALAMLTMH